MKEEIEKSHNSYAKYIIISLGLICVAAVCFIIFFLHGGTTVIENGSEDTTQERLICKSTTTAYPLFTYDNSNSKTMDITATFNNDELKSISLIYKLYYNDAELIAKSESVNHGALNTLSQNEGLGPDAFDAKFGKLKDSLQLSLYAAGSDINEKALKYFMLDSLNSKPYTQDKLMKVYTGQGFSCEAQK